MTRHFRLALLPLLPTLACLVLPVQARGQAAAGSSLSETLRLDPQVAMGTLPNGLRYYIRANPKPEKRMDLRLAVNAGSVLEDDDQKGLAHFVEHMAFNGTAHFQKQALVDYIEQIGMRFGPDLNGYTSFDETVYVLQVPTDSVRIVEQAFQILEDWARWITFDPEEVRRERGVVIEEWRLGRGAGARMRDRQLPVLFRGSRYAERLPIGDRNTLETFDPAALRRFYVDWYRPDLMALVAVGDIDTARVADLIRRHFLSMPVPEKPRPRTLFPVPDHDSTLVAIATDREATGSSVAMYSKQPVRVVKTVGDYRQSLVEGFYRQMLNQRLYEWTRKPDPPFIGAGIGQGRLVRSSEVCMLNASVKEGGIGRGLEAVLAETERVARHGFEGTELDRARANLLRGYEKAYAEREKTLSGQYASEYVRCFLQEEPAPGIAREYELAKALAPGVSLEEVNQLARTWVTDRNRVILVNGPEKAGAAIPAEAEIRSVFDRVKAKPVAAYADTVSDAPLLDPMPPPSAILAEKADTALGTVEWRLANGVRVILKPTDFKADEVLFTAFSPGGTSLAPDRSLLSATFASQVAGLGGLGRFGAIELQKKLAGKAVGVNTYMSGEEEGLRGSSSPRDLETLLQLIHLSFTRARADSGAFAAFKTNLKAMLLNRGANPMAAFQDTLQVTLTRYHPRALPVTSARVDEIDLGRAMGFYRDRFADAGDFTFVFVGAFKPDSMRTLVRTYLGGLPSAGRKETWRDNRIEPPKGVVERIVKKGIEPKSQTQLVFTGSFDYGIESRYALRSMVDVMNIRLREQLREALGGTYNVSAGISLSRIPRKEYSISVSYGSSPDRAEALLKTVFAQIDTLRTLGPSEKDLAKVGETQLRSYETNLKQNGYWLSQLAFAVQTGESPRNILAYRQRVGTLSVDIVRKAARRYLNPKNFVRVTLYPEDRPPVDPGKEP